MKIFNLFLFVALISISVDAQVNSSSMPLIKYKYDYRKCLFTISATKWIQHNGRNVLPITTTLNNTSDDTLAYWVMTQQNISYDLDNKDLTFENLNIDKNIPTKLIIPPHQKQSYLTNLVKIDDSKYFKRRLRMKFFLILPKDNKTIEWGCLGFCYPIDNKGKVIKSKYDKDLKKRTHPIWSNQIVI